MMSKPSSYSCYLLLFLYKRAYLIIEHMFFFVIGALSVKVAEITLRTITVRERKRRLHIEEAEKEKKMPEATASISQSGTVTYVCTLFNIGKPLLELYSD